MTFDLQLLHEADEHADDGDEKLRHDLYVKFKVSVL